MNDLPDRVVHGQQDHDDADPLHGQIGNDELRAIGKLKKHGVPGPETVPEKAVGRAIHQLSELPVGVASAFADQSLYEGIEIAALVEYVTEGHSKPPSLVLVPLGRSWIIGRKSFV